MRDLHKVLSQQFGIVFQDEKLLETAFTHTSYANEHRLLNISHNERLEFLGDAVLQLLISEYLYKKYPKNQKGTCQNFAQPLYVKRVWLVLVEIASLINLSN